MTSGRLVQFLIGLGGLLVVVGFFGLLTSGSDSPVKAVASTTTIATPASTAAPDAPLPEATITATTATTEPVTTDPVATTLAPTTTLARNETVEEFVLLYAKAIADRDVDFLFDRLHPAVVGGFGATLCQDWIDSEILLLEGYVLTGSIEGPFDKDFTTPAGTGAIKDTFSGPIAFTFQGQSFASTADFALVDGEIRWLGQCR